MIGEGDWVWPKLESKVRLISGGRDYHFAFVTSVDPFILVSQHRNVTWVDQNINEFERMI